MDFEEGKPADGASKRRLHFQESAGNENAGELIDQAGLRGTRVGSAEVSHRHANFIVAETGATPGDVLKPIDLVRGRVHERLGIELELEIEIW